MRDDRLLLFMLTSLCCALALAAHVAHAAPPPTAALQTRVQAACTDALAPLTAAGWQQIEAPRTQLAPRIGEQPYAVVCTAKLRGRSGAAAGIRIEANAVSGGFVTLVPFDALEARPPVSQAYRSEKAQPATGDTAAAPATILFIGHWRPLAGEDGSYGCDFLFPDDAAKAGIYNYFIRIDADPASADNIVHALDWSALDSPPVSGAD